MARKQKELAQAHRRAAMNWQKKMARNGHCPKCGKTAGHLKPCLLVDCPVRIDGTVRQSDIQESGK